MGRVLWLGNIENISNNIKRCIICNSVNLYYAFSLDNHRVARCNECELMLINPQPSDEVIDSIYSSEYSILSSSEEDRLHTEKLKKLTAERYLSILLEGEEPYTKALLEIGCGNGDFLRCAEDRGIKVTGIDYSEHACGIARSKLNNSQSLVYAGEIDQLLKRETLFDYIVFNDVLEHVRDPRGFLKAVYALLKPNGLIFCVVPSLDSISARIQKTNWVEFKLEHLFYFNSKNLRSILFQNGFSGFKHYPAKKVLSLHYIGGHFMKYPMPFWSSFFKITQRLIPKYFMQKPISITASGIVMLACKRTNLDQQLLTVIMPVYNEVSTVRDGIERVINKEIDGINMELIIVESNSTDGSKEIVAEYASHPMVTVIFEERPLGKGHAVRTGFKCAKGDYLLIQDADDEYDICDYDVLIEPLRDGREAFVLGARHGGGAFKMREFSDQPFKAIIMNFGHLIFTMWVNLFFGVWLKDPFTMYKVFRRDCIEGVKFECNRFDFDYELLIKLVRRGYKPLEIPVNYRSRSFTQGKKVRMFADPWTWAKAIIKYRFVKV